ncbi:MAG TPA: hypothetical protein VI756_05860 [Blastocatellia bacterium]
MSVNDVLNAVRAMSPEERARIRALLDALGSEAGTPADVTKQREPNLEGTPPLGSVGVKASPTAGAPCQNDQNPPYLEGLCAAARKGSAADFVSAMTSVDWRSLAPGDFITAARLALEAGAYAAAREISAEGAKRHPYDAEINKYAYILGPPKIVSMRNNPDPSVGANRAWIKAHRSEYSGNWVGLRSGVLLGYDESLQNLVNRLGKSEDILFTKVY